jgi:L-aminopeptidase/D-esterase-like protein
MTLLDVSAFGLDIGIAVYAALQVRGRGRDLGIINISIPVILRTHGLQDANGT